MHIREVELVFALCFENLLILRPVKVGETAFFAPFTIFFGRHHYGCVHIGVAYFVSDDISVERIIIFHRLAHIFRPCQIG